MSRYVRSTTKTIEFDGDTVTVTLAPITQGDLLALRAASQGAEGTEQAFVREAARIVPQYVQISGLRDVAGSEISISEVASQAYFVPLLVDLTTQLLGISVPSNP